MATINYKWVYKDGANAPTALISGYQIADTFADATTAIQGDMLFLKDQKRLIMHDGLQWINVAPTAPLNIAGVSPANTPYTLTSVDDIIVVFAINMNIILSLSTVVKVKKYEIKLWGATSVTITGTGGEGIDNVASKFINIPFQNITLVPWPSVGWMIV